MTPQVTQFVSESKEQNSELFLAQKGHHSTSVSSDAAADGPAPCLSVPHLHSMHGFDVESGSCCPHVPKRPQFYPSEASEVKHNYVDL